MLIDTAVHAEPKAGQSSFWSGARNLMGRLFGKHAVPDGGRHLSVGELKNLRQRFAECAAERGGVVSARQRAAKIGQIYIGRPAARPGGPLSPRQRRACGAYQLIGGHLRQGTEAVRRHDGQLPVLQAGPGKQPRKADAQRGRRNVARHPESSIGMRSIRRGPC